MGTDPIRESPGGEAAGGDAAPQVSRREPRASGSEPPPLRQHLSRSAFHYADCSRQWMHPPFIGHSTIRHNLKGQLCFGDDSSATMLDEEGVRGRPKGMRNRDSELTRHNSNSRFPSLRIDFPTNGFAQGLTRTTSFREPCQIPSALPIFRASWCRPGIWRHYTGHSRAGR